MEIEATFSYQNSPKSSIKVKTKQDQPSLEEFSSLLFELGSSPESISTFEDFIKKPQNENELPLFYKIVGKVLDNNPQVFKILSLLMNHLPPRTIDNAAHDILGHIKVILESLENDSIALISSDMLEFLVATGFSGKYQIEMKKQDFHTFLSQQLFSSSLKEDPSYSDDTVSINRTLISHILVNLLPYLNKKEFVSFVQKFSQGYNKHFRHAFLKEVLTPIHFGSSLSKYALVYFTFKDDYDSDNDETRTDSSTPMKDSSYYSDRSDQKEFLFTKELQEALDSEVQSRHYDSSILGTHQPIFHINWRKSEDIHDHELDLVEADCKLILFPAFINNEFIQVGIYIGSGFLLDDKGYFTVEKSPDNFSFYYSASKGLNFLSNNLTITIPSLQAFYQDFENFGGNSQSIIKIFDGPKTIVDLDLRDYKLKLDLNYFGTQSLSFCEFYEEFTEAPEIWIGYPHLDFNKLKKANFIYSSSRPVHTLIRKLENSVSNKKLFFGLKENTLKSLLRNVFPGYRLNEGNIEVFYDGKNIDIDKVTLDSLSSMSEKYGSTRFIELLIVSPSHSETLKTKMVAPEVMFENQIIEDRRNPHDTATRAMVDPSTILDFLKIESQIGDSMLAQKIATMFQNLIVFEKLMVDLLGKEKFSLLFFYATISPFNAEQTLKLMYNSLLKELICCEGLSIKMEEIKPFLYNGLSIKGFSDQLYQVLNQAPNLNLADNAEFLNLFVNAMLWKGNTLEYNMLQLKKIIADY